MIIVWILLYLSLSFSFYYPSHLSAQNGAELICNFKFVISLPLPVFSHTILLCLGSFWASAFGQWCIAFSEQQCVGTGCPGHIAVSVSSLSCLKHVLDPNFSNTTAWSLVLSFKLWRSIHPSGVIVSHAGLCHIMTYGLLFVLWNDGALVGSRHKNYLVMYKKRPCFGLR